MVRNLFQVNHFLIIILNMVIRFSFAEITVYYYYNEFIKEKICLILNYYYDDDIIENKNKAFN